MRNNYPRVNQEHPHPANVTESKENRKEIRQFTMPSISEFDPWNDDSVRKDQLGDREIKQMIEFKESNETPSWQDIAAAFHPTTKH
ncbi:hypothetical protein TNCV_3443161 [Trichonephila clavipes]|nr:hypothetical protein TNCV_3443161 [Trichonephila clavipes]